MPTPLESPTAETKTFLYALCEPLTGEIRYIGKTDKPKARLQRHIWYATKRHPSPTFHAACWIRSLAAAGQMPIMKILREVPYAERNDWERRAIRVYRAVGFDLTNTTGGGDGSERGERNPNFGKKYSPERCAAMSAAGKGRTPWNKGRKSPETSGENHHTFGKTFSAETLARMSAAAKGRPAWNKGKPTDEKTLEKLASVRLRGKKKGAKSQFIGVYWDQSWPGWKVSVRVTGKYIFVGNSKDETEAARMSDAAAIKYFGPNTKLNFPNG